LLPKRIVGGMPVGVAGRDAGQELHDMCSRPQHAINASPCVTAFPGRWQHPPTGVRGGAQWIFRSGSEYPGACRIKSAIKSLKKARNSMRLLDWLKNGENSNDGMVRFSPNYSTRSSHSPAQKSPTESSEAPREVVRELSTQRVIHVASPEPLVAAPPHSTPPQR
jgi:hypothetical protein